FNRIFGELPQEGRDGLVENHLSSVLDLVDEDVAKKILDAANTAHQKYKSAPDLNLSAKSKEVAFLLDELSKDAKRAFFKDRCNTEELLTEIMHTLAVWLSDIWSSVYEHNANFSVAHMGLLFIAETITQIMNTPPPSGCKCSVLNLPIQVEIRSRTGKCMIEFSFAGPPNLDRVLLWVWRDLFVSLYLVDKERADRDIPSMLADIDTAMGWSALERLLLGGQRPPKSHEWNPDDWNDEDYGDEEDGDDDDDSDEEQNGLVHSCSYLSSRCYHRPLHWDARHNNARFLLQQAVQARMERLFSISPSRKLYLALVGPGGVCEDPRTVDLMRATLLRQLSEMAPICADTLVAAIDVYTEIGEEQELAALIRNHSYLLRPRDAVALQCAVAVLSAKNSMLPIALSTIERELMDCVSVIHSAVQANFSRLDEAANREKLAQILRLRSNSGGQRQDRIESWVDAVATPINPMPHPVAFAAMLMGLPMSPEDDGEDDFIDHFDQSDPDLEDLREEFRPRLKDRFDGWVQTAHAVKTGSQILLRVYKVLCDTMPFLRAQDIGDEMLMRLSDRPSKAHVADAIDTLTTFVKAQRKKMYQRAGEKRKRSQQAA
ncbi:hypothetical protein FISHEDRAFT_22609, partial [Fistulina hepatica ATCC 64428]